MKQTVFVNVKEKCDVNDITDSHFLSPERCEGFGARIPPGLFTLRGREDRRLFLQQTFLQNLQLLTLYKCISNV